MTTHEIIKKLLYCTDRIQVFHVGENAARARRRVYHALYKRGYRRKNFVVASLDGDLVVKRISLQRGV